MLIETVLFPNPQVVGDAHESAMENISLVSWGLNWLQSQDTRTSFCYLGMVVVVVRQSVHTP